MAPIVGLTPPSNIEAIYYGATLVYTRVSEVPAGDYGDFDAAVAAAEAVLEDQRKALWADTAAQGFKADNWYDLVDDIANNNRDTTNIVADVNNGMLDSVKVDWWDWANNAKGANIVAFGGGNPTGLTAMDNQGIGIAGNVIDDYHAFVDGDTTRAAVWNIRGGTWNQRLGWNLSFTWMALTGTNPDDYAGVTRGTIADAVAFGKEIMRTNDLVFVQQGTLNDEHGSGYDAEHMTFLPTYLGLQGNNADEVYLKTYAERYILHHMAHLAVAHCNGACLFGSTRSKQLYNFPISYVIGGPRMPLASTYHQITSCISMLGVDGELCRFDETPGKVNADLAAIGHHQGIVDADTFLLGVAGGPANYTGQTTVAGVVRRVFTKRHHTDGIAYSMSALVMPVDRYAGRGGMSKDPWSPTMAFSASRGVDGDVSVAGLWDQWVDGAGHAMSDSGLGADIDDEWSFQHRNAMLRVSTRAAAGLLSFTTGAGDGQPDANRTWGNFRFTQHGNAYFVLWGSDTMTGPTACAWEKSYNNFPNNLEHFEWGLTGGYAGGYLGMFDTRQFATIDDLVTYFQANVTLALVGGTLTANVPVVTDPTQPDAVEIAELVCDHRLNTGARTVDGVVWTDPGTSEIRLSGQAFTPTLPAEP